jgi:hypothetical protein
MLVAASLFEPEVPKVFPDAGPVNAALRALAKIAKRAGSIPRRER